MKKNLINGIFSFNCIGFILSFNYSSFIFKFRLHNYFLRANRRLLKKIKFSLNLSDWSVADDFEFSALQYSKHKRYFLFYVTLVILFGGLGVLDIFFSSNSAASLMIYLLSIIIVLLLGFYGSLPVLNTILEIESYLISFSSIKSKSLLMALTLLNVSSSLKTALSSVFFNIWKISFVRSVVFGFAFYWHEFSNFSLRDGGSVVNAILHKKDRLYKF